MADPKGAEEVWLPVIGRALGHELIKGIPIFGEQ